MNRLRSPDTRAPCVNAALAALDNAVAAMPPETVPPGGTREKSPGVTMPSAPPEAQKHPRHSHHNRGISAEMQCGTAPRVARDFTGEPCSPVNPFFLDGEHPHPADRGPGGLSNLPVGHSSSIPLARSLLDRSSGPFSFRRRSRHGPSGPRRKCGVRRREPLCGATGVYQIKGDPAALCAVGNKREWGAGKHPSWRGLKARPLAA